MVCFALFFFFLGLNWLVWPRYGLNRCVLAVSLELAQIGASREMKKKKTGQGTDARAAVLLARCRVRRRCGAHFATFVHPRAQLVDTSERCQSI